MNALVVSRKQAVQSTIFSIKEDRFALEVLRGQEIKLIHPVSNSSFRECLSQDLIFFIAVLTFNNIKQYFVRTVLTFDGSSNLILIWELQKKKY